MNERREGREMVKDGENNKREREGRKAEKFLPLAEQLLVIFLCFYKVLMIRRSSEF